MAEAQFAQRGEERLLAELQSNVSANRWATWFSGVRIELDGDVLEVRVPSDFHMKWLRDHYRDLLESLAAEWLGSAVEVRYLVEDAPPADGGAGAETRDGDQPGPAEAPENRPDGRPRAFSPLLDKYIFDNFVVGQSNRLALAAAQAVSEKPGEHFNPLFLYGGAGLGKTHLLYAIVHNTRKIRPETKVRYVTSENFFNEFVNGIRSKRMNDFKFRYRNSDLLLLDDIQFFQNKEQVLEEIFHTFNALYEQGKQMVLSCDRPPKDLGFEERLQSRFQWGLLADISPPAVETRLAILQRNAEYAPAPVPDEVLEFIAQHITDNIRTLESALTKITAFAGLTNQPITLDLAQAQLQDLLNTTGERPPTGEEIIAVTAVAYGYTPGDLQGPSRKQRLVKARHTAMFLCRRHTDLSLPRIGRLLGGRDHTTVIHGIEKTKERMRSDADLARQVSKLSETLCSK